MRAWWWSYKENAPKSRGWARSLGYSFAYTNLCFVQSHSILTGLHAVYSSSTVQPMWEWDLIGINWIRMKAQAQAELAEQVTSRWWNIESLCRIACQGKYDSALLMDLLNS